MSTFNPVNNLFPTGSTGGSSNQYGSYPSLPNFNPSSSGNTGAPGTTDNSGFITGINPSTGTYNNASPTGSPNLFYSSTPGGQNVLGTNTYTAPTYDPSFTSSFYQQLSSLLGGQGGSGGLQSQLLSFLGGGPSNIPGSGQLSAIAQTGDPINVLPEWQQMIAAQQQNIQQNEANLKKQFAFGGDLQSSPFATGISNYLQQTTADQNSLLGQLSTQASQQAVQNSLTASSDLTGLAGSESQFIEQLLSSGSTSSPGVINKASNSNLLGGIGSILGGLGTAAGEIGSAIGAAGGGGGAAALTGLLAAI